MAFAFNSNHYSSTGQASFMFTQHHQLPCVTLKIFFTVALFSIDIDLYLTNPPTPCQVVFELASIFLQNGLKGFNDFQSSSAFEKLSSLSG
jgi:hypothetical protein